MLHRTCTAEFVFLKNSYLLFSFTPQGFISLRVSPETFPNELNCCTKDNCAAWPPLHSVYLIYLNSDSNVWCQIITVVTVKSLKRVLNKCFCSNNSKDCSSESFKSYFLIEFPASSFPSVYSTMIWAALQKSLDISPKAFVSPAIYQGIPPGVHACSKIYSVHLMYFNCRYIKEMKTKCDQQRDETNETKSHNDGHRPSTFHLAPPEDFM